jgi:hypothetical protein
MWHKQICQWFIAFAVLLSLAFGIPLATSSPGTTDHGELWITSQGTSPQSDEIIFIDLTTRPVTRLRTLLLQPRPGAGNNQPDSIGYEPVAGNFLPVTLRAAGQLALVNLADLTVKFVPIAPPTSFDPKTCAGCAIHGVAVRPRSRPGQ